MSVRLSLVTLAMGMAACGSTVDLGNGHDQEKTPQWASSVDSRSADGGSVQSIYEGLPVRSIDVDDTYLVAVLRPQIGSPDCPMCSGKRSIVACRLDACAATVTTLAIVDDPQYVEGSVFLSAGEVFWVSAPDAAQSTGVVVLSCPVDGCTGGPRQICAIIDFLGANFTADVSYVYWIKGARHIMRCSREGSASPEEVHETTTSVFPGNALTDGQIVLTDDAMFVRYTSSAGVISRLPRKGAGDDVLVYQGFPVGSLAARNDDLYFVTQILSGQVLHCGKSGCGDSPEVLSSAGRWPDYVLVDDRDVYWRSEMNLFTCPRAGCNERRLATSLAKATGALPFVMNSRYLFWVEYESTGNQAFGTIKAMVK